MILFICDHVLSSLLCLNWSKKNVSPPSTTALLKRPHLFGLHKDQGGTTGPVGVGATGWTQLPHVEISQGLHPIPSMYGIFTYIWLIFMVNVGKYTIHGSYGDCKIPQLCVQKICWSITLSSATVGKSFVPRNSSCLSRCALSSQTPRAERPSGWFEKVRKSRGDFSPTPTTLKKYLGS